jgi:hypothetical protein
MPTTPTPDHEGACDSGHNHPKHKSKPTAYDTCTKMNKPGQRWDTCAYTATCEQLYAPADYKCSPGCMCPRGWVPKADGSGCGRRRDVCKCDKQHVDE